MNETKLYNQSSFLEKKPPSDASKVAIFLCTHYGQKFLVEQLDSFEAQSHNNWEIWASDDGSQDNTRSILLTYQDRWPKGRLNIRPGPEKGFLANFLSLTCCPNVHADFFAYSDQDDIWEADKLNRAVKWLETVPEGIPALYCGRTRLVDADNLEIGTSPLFHKRPSFANALMQNIGGGNTMVFNNATRELLLEAGQSIDVVTHDWWAYMLVTGCGGQVFYDPRPTLRYRQHGGNLVGQNNTWPARFTRIRMLWQGRFKRWNDANIAALMTMHHRLTPEHHKLLCEFAHARQQVLVKRLRLLKRTGIYRQTSLGNLGLVAAALFGKL